jgi:hypothetical protein
MKQFQTFGQSVALILTVLAISPLAASPTLDLAGPWRFALDRHDKGIEAKWFEKTLDTTRTLSLPGTTAQADVGEPDRRLDAGFLLQDHRFVGAVWYERDIEIPDTWTDQVAELTLERCLWETRVWVDGQPFGTQNSLTTPHRYTLGSLTPGKHRLTIRVDNRQIVNTGTMSHSYSDETQSIWNGLTGALRLDARPPDHIDSIQAFPAADATSVKVDIRLINRFAPNATLKLVSRLLQHDQVLAQAEQLIIPTTSETQTSVVLTPQSPLQRWDEFNPALYQVEVAIRSNGQDDVKRVSFGARSFTREGRHILVNGRPVQLRGTLECCVFPKTGYPPTDVESWKRIFTLAKSYGLNHFRFHSWCPPDAAFTAADELGIYLQPETPLWIDSWMKDRSPTHPDVFGQDPAVVEFIRAEVDRILETYGNHPSFCMFMLGNELPESSDYAEMQRIVNDARQRDPRRLYAISTARLVTPSDDYSASHASPGGATRGLGKPNTDWDFSKAVQSLSIPLIQHESGQRPVFPDYGKLDSYTGPLKPHNLEVYRDALAARGMLGQNRDFTLASEKWTAIQYRQEIEGVLRTPDYAGFQLLQLNDFTGQGEALVGLLDPFWNPKGDLSPEYFRQFCAPTVPLLRFEKYTWTSSETFKAQALVSHFGPRDLKDIKLCWQLNGPPTKAGLYEKRGELDARALPTGGLTPWGEFQIPLGFVKIASSYQLTLSLFPASGNQPPLASNTWTLWIYPEIPEPKPFDNVLVVRHYDDKAQRALAEGKRVVLLPQNARNDNAYSGQFYSVYWSAKFFPAPDAQLGLWCDPTHPALQGFPTDSHTDWQWRSLVEGSKTFLLDGAPPDYRPIVQAVPDFHLNHKMGFLFETRVGEGRLLVCGLNTLANTPEARHFYASILRYATSPAFAPTTTLDPELLKTLFSEGEPPRTIPGEALNIQAAADLSVQNLATPWDAQQDRVLAQENGYRAEVLEGGAWNDATGSAWFGAPLRVRLQTPRGVKGQLFLHFSDWNNNGRTGSVQIETRPQQLGPHTGEGKWLVLDILREDTLDDKIEILATPKTGPNLQLTQIIFKPQ